MTFSTWLSSNLAYGRRVFISYIGTDSIGSLIKRFAAKKAGVEDGEINNQRKAFLDMLAWSEGTDGRWKTRNPWLWRHCRRRALYLLITPITLTTCHAKPKLKSTGAGRYQLLSRWWDAYRKQLGLKDFSPKSQDAVALQRIEDVALYLWLIVVISVRQSTVAAISGSYCRALVMVSSSIRLTAWLQNSKAGGTGQRLMYEQSHRDYLHSGYLHHRLPVMGC